MKQQQQSTEDSSESCGKSTAQAHPTRIERWKKED